jgi:hypothetical protein
LRTWESPAGNVGAGKGALSECFVYSIQMHSRFMLLATDDFQGFIVADSVVLRPAALFVLAAVFDSVLGELGVVPVNGGLLDAETVEAGGSPP